MEEFTGNPLKSNELSGNPGPNRVYSQAIHFKLPGTPILQPHSEHFRNHAIANCSTC